MKSRVEKMFDFENTRPAPILKKEFIKLRCNRCGSVFEQAKKFHFTAEFIYTACKGRRE